MDCITNNELATIIFYDAMQQNHESTENRLRLLNQVSNNHLFYTNQELCHDYIRSVEQKTKLFLITTAHGALDILEATHNLRQIDSIFIYCQTVSEKEYHDKILNDKYSKIINVFTNFEDLTESIRENLELLQKENETFSYYKQHQKSIRELSKESVLFYWTLLFKHVILQLPHDEQAKQELIDQMKQHYRNNHKQLKLIDNFRLTYKSEDALRWYAEQPFLYKTINRALRTENIEQLYTFRYFITDLCLLLKEKYLVSFADADTLTLYRGTRIKRKEIEKLSNSIGELISTNGYLSTSLSENIAKYFAGDSNTSSLIADDRQPIVFQIECNLNELKDTIIFAYIAPFVPTRHEQEFLFDLGATFQITSVNLSISPCKILMKAVDEGYKLAHEYIELNQTEMEELKSPVFMYGRLLFDMGKLDECQRYFEHILNSSSGHQTDLASLYINLGRIHGEKGKFDDELKNYNHALEILIKNQREKDSSMVLNNIGSFYLDKGELDKSIEYFNRALDIEEKYLPRSHQNTAMSLMNLGYAHYQKSDYDTALAYQMKSLEMKRRILPNDHTLIADSLEHIGNIYWSQKKFTAAHEYYENALKMRKKLLPSTHIDITKSLMNLGNVLCDIGRITEGIEFYKDALSIQQQLYPDGHPSVALTLYNISVTYIMKKNLTLAAEYNDKALLISRRFGLVDTHPYIIAMNNNASEINRLKYITFDSEIRLVNNSSCKALISFKKSIFFLSSPFPYFRLCYAHFFPLFSFVPLQH